jgi:choline dehydrogenase
MENIYEGQVNGLVKCMNTIYKGVRSTSTVFLDGKPNITVLAETRAKWLVIKNGVAIGVVVYSPHEEDVVYIAKKDVIVSCGVFESPKLLMLSGIRPRDQLRQHYGGPERESAIGRLALWPSRLGCHHLILRHPYTA